MPFPPVHLTFFILLLFPIAIYGFVKTARQGKIELRDWGHLLLLLSIGGFFSLFPDISAAWNYLQYGKLEGQCMIGSFPTHSLLFTSIAFVGGTLAGLLVYRHRGKALALGLFAEATSLFHLVLDDLDAGIITYLYPLYNEPFSLFSFLNTNYTDVGILYYSFTVLAGVFLFVFVVLMALMSLRYLGFGLRYEPLKIVGVICEGIQVRLFHCNWGCPGCINLNSVINKGNFPKYSDSHSSFCPFSCPFMVT